MPATRNTDEDHPLQESVEQTMSVENSHITEGPSDTGQTLDNSGAEVSSTTVDLDPVSHASQALDVQEGLSEHVQSTSIDASSDSLDGFKEQTVNFDEAASKPSSSTGSAGRGFQDAFAAFASASASYHEPEEESPMEVGSDVCDAAAEPRRESIVTAVSCFSSVESAVSSPIDSGQVTTTGESFSRSVADVDSVESVVTETAESEPQQQVESYPETDTYSQQTSVEGLVPSEISEQTNQTQYNESQQTDTAVAANDSVYFIQMTDSTGQVVTSIIDPNDIPSYADSVVYKQCMRADGEIETTVVYSGGIPVTQEEQVQEQTTSGSEEADSQQGEQQIIYAHDLNGHLTPIDSAQSINDVAPPGKQFVYMQDSTGRIIRTIMDANQTMVPGQQVYYTQSEDGRIITSVMDSSAAEVSEEAASVQQPQEAVDQIYQQRAEETDVLAAQQQEATAPSVVGGTSSFNMDNSMSGLSMLAELSHLTAGQTSTSSGLATGQRSASSTDSSSMDLDEFRPVAMVTRQMAGEEGLESEIAELKVGEADSDSLDQGSLLQGDGAGQEETLITKLVSQLKGEQTQQPVTVSRDNLFVQWQNLDAMCWMDVVLIMLVSSPTLRPLIRLDPTHELVSTLLITLLKANRQAQVLLQNLLKKSNGAEISSLQTGAGNTVSIQDPKTSKLVCKENMDEIGKAINILYAMREKIWQALQPRLRCERGKHNSPVLVLPLIVREKPAIKQMFTMSYRYVFKCEKCGYSQDDSHTKILPSIPAVPDDFNMKAPCFVRNCFECQAPNQRMLMKFEVLHDFVQMHFVKGLPHSRFDELSFDFNDDLYEVTAVVHYKNNPDHFIAWVRNAPGPAWMECDDLKSVLTCYLNVSPNIPPGQVHMVMWERRLTPQHTLVMRDTEDTRLLASLVLTVQQPNAHRTTDPAARPTGMPSTATTTASSPATASPVSAPAQTTSILPGVQTQTFSPYTPRQKGRGRGSRGSYGARGHLTTAITPIIRRVSPAVSQLPAQSATQTTPQIVRLPLNLNMRGSSPAPTRYVLIGGSSQSGAASTTAPTRAVAPSKVVVVRSQGGTTNISATQLLQLLQRTGAISQPGARITTTVTTSGANSDGATSAGSTTSYIIQQDGTIVAAPVESAASQVSLEKSTLSQSSLSSSVLDSTIEQSTEGTVLSETQQTEQIVSPLVAGQNISTLPYSGTTVSLSDHAQSSDAITQSAESGTHAVSTSQAETWSAVSSESEVSREQQGPSGQAVSLIQGQQPTRYIQVPNPAGGSMLLKQLGIRDGKMVLVPVDKNVQTQGSGTSVLKLSGSTPTSSPKITIRVPATSPQTVSSTSAGSVLAQIQQHLLQAQSTASSTAAGPRVITLPGTSGNQRVQLITVPRGVSASQTNQTGGKTIIMRSVGQQSASSTTASTITRLAAPGETSSPDAHVISQSGNIVIRELKRTEGDIISSVASSVGPPSLSLDAGRATSAPTVSLFKDMSRPTTASVGTSLLTSPTQQKPQENFRYILPGSNTTHILHTGTSGLQAGLGQAGRAFTALSSSGTIIGGQLTPSSSAASDTSSVDNELALGSSEDSGQGTNLLTPRRQLSRELDTTEYIPLGRGRTRGGHRGGRGRGGRTPRGRGRSQLWTSDAELIAPVPASTGKISTLSDLRQIGAHIIETGSETVDGVPVVSIPDFSSEGPAQTEILSAAQSIISETAAGTAGQGISDLSDAASQLVLPDVEQVNLSVSDAIPLSQGPRVITQSIPSVKANHGFDILTQGILGSGDTARSTMRHARSLLTGATTVLHTPASLLTTLTDNTAASLVSEVPPVQEPVGEAEIDTLIQAAQAAARHQKAESHAAIESSLKDVTSAVETDSQMDEGGLGAGDPTAVAGADNDQNVDSDLAHSMSSELQQGEEPEEPVVSVDESQVSAAERYRMPMELFQPDEESPEKSSKSDDATNRSSVDLPSRLFQESEVIPQVEELTKPQQSKERNVKRAAAKGSGRRKSSLNKMAPSIENSKDVAVQPNRDETLMETESSADMESTPVESSTDATSVEVGTEDSSSVAVQLNRSAEDATEVSTDTRPADDLVANLMLEVAENAVHETSVPAKKTGRPRGRPVGRSSKRKGRRKSSSAGASEILDAPQLDVDSAEPGGVTSESSLDRKIAQNMTSPETEFSQLSPKSSPEKYSKPDLVDAVTFGTDLLVEQADEEKAQESVENIRDSSSLNVEADLQEEVELPAAKKQQMYAELREEEKTVKKSAIYSPAFVRYKKEKINWDVDSGNKGITQHRHCFSYRVLRGKPVKSQPRHPSLGPAHESFISAPPPLPARCPKELNSPQQPLPAVVLRNSPRPLQKPKADPSKEPVVIPLEDTGDPASTGGSVISSPSIGEIFTGVVVKRKQDAVDWRVGADEEEEDVDISESLADEELQAGKREYCKQLITELFMYAGDFSAVVDDFTESHLSDEEKQAGADEQGCKLELSEVDKLEVATDSKSSDVYMPTNTAEACQTIRNSSKSRVKKRKQAAESPASSSSAKQARSSQDEDSDICIQNPSHSEIDSTIASSTPSRVNGIDVAAPAHLSQATSESMQVQQRDAPVAAPSQLSFPSPSRRSGRIPVPSKKVLDAWEEFPARSALKGRRASSVSSDDELSGYSSGDTQHKKIKSKQAFSPS